MNPRYIYSIFHRIDREEMATTGEQAYRERYKRTNEQARGEIRVEGASRAGSYISSRAEGIEAENRRNDAS